MFFLKKRQYLSWEEYQEKLSELDALIWMSNAAEQSLNGGDVKW